MRIGLAGTGRIGAFHAKTLTTLDGVDDLVLADLDTALAERVATDLGVGAAPSIDALLDSGLDAFVITAGTAAHAELLEAAISRGIPTFCEKPVALDLERTIALTELEATSAVPVHIGFQRRFDTGYRRVRDAVASGELGFIHTVRAATMDQAPPHAAYLPTSGGLFRDCSVHDFDILRFVTGQRGQPGLRRRRQQGRAVLHRGRRRRHRGRDARARRRHPRLGHGDPLQRRRARRADGGARLQGHARRRARHHPGDHLGRARHRVAARAAALVVHGALPAGLRHRAHRVRRRRPGRPPRARAPSPTPSRRSAPPRPAPARWRPASPSTSPTSPTVRAELSVRG